VPASTARARGLVVVRARASNQRTLQTLRAVQKGAGPDRRAVDRCGEPSGAQFHLANRLLRRPEGYSDAIDTGIRNYIGM
jgi:hypothetical protein